MNFIFKEKQKNRNLHSLPIERLSPYSPAHRKSFDNYQISQLAESIRVNGILDPLDVVRDGEDYRIISGIRRYRAARLVGLKSLPCRVLPERGAHLLKALIINTYHRPLNPFEEAENIEELLGRAILTAGEVAEALNLPKTGLEDRLKVLKFTADERKIILKEGITHRQMKALLRFRDEIIRFKALEEVAESGLSPLDTERYVEKILNPPDEERAEIRQSTAVYLDKRVLDNTFKKVIETAEKSGIDIIYLETEDPDCYEYTFRLPKGGKKLRAEIL